MKKADTKKQSPPAKADAEESESDSGEEADSEKESDSESESESEDEAAPKKWFQQRTYAGHHIPRGDRNTPRGHSGKAKKIYLSGLDGYSIEDPRRREMDETLEVYSSLKKKSELVSITPTRYKIKSSSVYA